MYGCLYLQQEREKLGRKSCSWSALPLPALVSCLSCPHTDSKYPLLATLQLSPGDGSFPLHQNIEATGHESLNVKRLTTPAPRPRSASLHAMGSARGVSPTPSTPLQSCAARPCLRPVTVLTAGYPLEGSTWASWRPHRLHVTPAGLSPMPALSPGLHVSGNDTITHLTS